MTDSPSNDRRKGPRRGPGRLFQDGLYRSIRWIGRHVRGFYGAVGLFLVFGLALSALALASFAAITEWALGGTSARLDAAAVSVMRTHAAPLWDWLALAGAALGSGVAMWIVIGLGTLFLWRSRHHYSAALLWVALLGGRFLNHELKTLFRRSRPEPAGWDLTVFGRAVDFPTSFSFPSGHATMAVVIYGTLAYLVARLETTPAQRRWTFAAVAVVILLIGASRVYLGVHYPTDVAAGYLSGFVWATSAALAIEAVRYFRTREPRVAREEKDIDEGLEPLRETLH